MEENTMKRILFLFLTVSILFCSACNTPKYRTDFPIYDLADQAIDALNPDIQYVRADRNYLDGYFPLSQSVTEQEIYFASDGNNLDEFGIFYTDDPDDLAEDLRDYLEDSFEENKSFYDSYIPEQTPKLRDAEVRVFGNCVAYAILAKEHRDSFFSTIEKNLKI